MTPSNHRKFSEDEVVRVAVGKYLARHARDWTEWDRRFDDLSARVREHMPADVTPEEVEADITAAREVVRIEMLRAAEESRPPGVGNAL